MRGDKEETPTFGFTASRDVTEHVTPRPYTALVRTGYMHMCMYWVAESRDDPDGAFTQWYSLAHRASVGR